MINVIVKGPKKAATRAAARRGITLRSCRTVDKDIVCKAPCKNFSKLGRWYGEHGGTKKGRGYPPGTVLIFSSEACPSGSLGGRGRRRRSRRR